MKNKLKNFIASKGGRGVIIGSSIFLVFGLACFIVGYGLIDGWDAVLAWFSSRWAVMVYIFVGLWIIMILWIYYIFKTTNKE